MLKKTYIIFSLFLGFFLYIVYFNIYSENNTFKKKYTKHIVIGHSMEPTISNGEKVYYNIDNSHLKRGEIVFFKRGKSIYIKRIIAIPGDKVIFGKDGYIYINGKKQIEKYIKTEDKFPADKIQRLLKQLEYYKFIIPRNNYILLGDNRFYSKDSFIFGMVDKNNIIGRIKTKTEYEIK